MEDKDENSLRAHKQTEDDLEGKGQFLEVGAGSSESKTPAKTQQQQEPNCNEEVLLEGSPNIILLSVNSSTAKFDHNECKYNPVEYAYNRHWKNQPHPKWPLCHPTTGNRHNVLHTISRSRSESVSLERVDIVVVSWSHRNCCNDKRGHCMKTKEVLHINFNGKIFSHAKL